MFKASGAGSLVGSVRPRDMDSETVILLALLAFAAVGGSYLTGVLCRLAHVRWYWAIAGTTGAGLLAASFVWLGLSIGGGDLGKGVKAWQIAGSVLVVTSGCALVPAVMTFLYYRFCRPKPSRSGNGV